MAQPHEIGYCHCPRCNALLSPPADTDKAWLNDLSSACPSCQQSADWWSVVAGVLRHQMVFFRHGAVGLLGGRILSFPIEMQPGGVYTLDLQKYGLDADASILYKNYTTQGGAVWALEIHGNEPITTRHSKLIHLYGRPLSEADLAVAMKDRPSSKINVYLVYVPQQAGRHTSLTLARAYEEFLDRDYPEMLIPASVAVEDDVKRLAAECLDREGLPNTQIRDRVLLLDSLLPLYCRANGRPWLPSEIRGKVRRLWGLRDEMAHGGQLKAPLTEEDAAVLLAAAILAVRFVQIFRATA